MNSRKCSDELDVGIGEIDAQHHHLANFINALAAAKITGTGRKQLSLMLDELAADMAAHFAFEVEMFEYTGYINAREHKRSHSKLLQQLGKYRFRFRAGDDVLDVVVDMLKTWLPNHIKHDDAKYAASLRDVAISVRTSWKENKNEGKSSVV